MSGSSEKETPLSSRGRREPAANAFPPGASTTTEPRVSILKPLSGLDDCLEENLASFARLTGVAYEVILSAEREGDPAVPAARRVMARFPEAPFRLVVGGGTGIALSNPKVERLVAAARAARGEIFFVSDSNVRVEPGDLAATVAAFDDPTVGCVSNVFTGAGARSFGAAIESLHLLTFVLPGTVLAAAGGVACVVGKSMALTRAAHDAIGGFAAFTHVLAEDQAIGCAVKAAGFRIALSEIVVRNVTVTRSLRRALDRQMRWGKIRYSFSKLTYTGELLLNPLPFSLLACGGAALGPSGLPPLPFAAAGAISFLRLAQGFVTRAGGARRPHGGAPPPPPRQRPSPARDSGGALFLARGRLAGPSRPAGAGHAPDAVAAGRGDLS